MTGFLHDPGHIGGLRRLGRSSCSANERLRRTMGRRARRVARERFSVDEMVDRYIRVYDSLRLMHARNDDVAWRCSPKGASRRSTPRPRSACCATAPTRWSR